MIVTNQRLRIRDRRLDAMGTAVFTPDRTSIVLGDLEYEIVYTNMTDFEKITYLSFRGVNLFSFFVGKIGIQIDFAQVAKSRLSSMAIYLTLNLC